VDSRHGAKEIVHEINLVDKVYQDGATAGRLVAAPSQWPFEIGGWFEESPEATDSSYGADCSSAKEVFGGEHVGIETTMMADQKFDIVLLHSSNQTGASIDISADRLLAEDVNTSFRKLRREGNMGVVRSTDDGGVRPVRASQEGNNGGVEDSGMEVCNLEGGGTGIYDCDEGSGGIGGNMLAMSLPYKATTADDCYS
jgi:hypothetical protein